MPVCNLWFELPGHNWVVTVTEPMTLAAALVFLPVGCPTQAAPGVEERVASKLATGQSR